MQKNVVLGSESPDLWSFEYGIGIFTGVQTACDGIIKTLYKSDIVMVHNSATIKLDNVRK